MPGPEEEEEPPPDPGPPPKIELIGPPAPPIEAVRREGAPKKRWVLGNFLTTAICAECGHAGSNHGPVTARCYFRGCDCHEFRARGEGGDG
jgi:hypothetical protein